MLHDTDQLRWLLALTSELLPPMPTGQLFSCPDPNPKNTHSQILALMRKQPVPVEPGKTFGG